MSMWQRQSIRTRPRPGGALSLSSRYWTKRTCGRRVRTFGRRFGQSRVGSRGPSIREIDVPGAAEAIVFTVSAHGMWFRVASSCEREGEL